MTNWDQYYEIRRQEWREAMPNEGLMIRGITYDEVIEMLAHCSLDPHKLKAWDQEDKEKFGEDRFGMPPRSHLTFYPPTEKESRWRISWTGPGGYDSGTSYWERPEKTQEEA